MDDLQTLWYACLILRDEKPDLASNVYDYIEELRRREQDQSLDQLETALNAAPEEAED